MILRNALVATAVAAAPHSLTLACYKNAAILAGFRVTEDELLAHVDYLVEKQYLRVEEDELSAGVKRWKGTVLAVEYAERNGL